MSDRSLPLSDPYHTYLSLAALSMYQPDLDSTHPIAASWKFERLDALLNAKQTTAEWALKYIPAPRV
jgi:geranylgeranyl transferase type-1 subunit beta